MQAQAVRSSTTRLQATLTAEQSLQTVQTLLQAGLGCITYLRELLPEDNFSERYLTSSTAPGLGNEPSRSGSFTSPTTPKHNISTFTIRTIKRGFTEEADRLLNCLELGIFDALERQYLKSFVFAIYLDNANPNNVIESYTFNFNYFEVDGTGVKAPVMSLGEGLMNMSLDDAFPVGNKPTRPPTLGEVKKSLRSLARRLIHAASQMDELPRRRFAAFKLYYYDHTPEDYEPPHFRKGDADKDRWYFTTHDNAEVPERTDLGKLETGWHSVEIQVASITSLLPGSDRNREKYLGTVGGPGAPSYLSPLQESEFRRKQAEAQIRDAEERRVVFDADPSPHMKIAGENIDPEVPLGILDEEGNIVTNLTNSSRTAHMSDQNSLSEKIVDAGRVEKCVADVRELAYSPHDTGIEKTQVLPPTEPMSNEAIPEGSDPVLPTQPSALAGISHGVQTQVLKNMFNSLPPSSQAADSEMLDLETQRLNLPREESIESFTAEKSMNVDPLVADRGLDCCCEVDLEDTDVCWCESCGRWYHTWCMGYHSARDKRIPNVYQCFDCRIRSDKNWDLIVMRDQHLVLISDFKDFVIFRRAIKIAEQMKAFNDHLEFTKKIGCQSEVATQLFRRLQTEGFLVQVETITDEMGLVEIQKPVTGKRRRPRAKAGSRYKFVTDMKKSQKYKRYFDPERDIKIRLARLGDLDGSYGRPPVISTNDFTMLTLYHRARARETGRALNTDDHDGSQTQPETQPVVHAETRSKRKSREEHTGCSKRTKVSLGDAVDLGD